MKKLKHSLLMHWGVEPIEAYDELIQVRANLLDWSGYGKGLPVYLTMMAGNG